MSKRFFIHRDGLKPDLAPGHGACIATDMILVQGSRVGYMYREYREPSSMAVDGGWRFFSGSETQTYVDDAANMSYYDVNTIANYDPEIIPFLRAPVGSAFARDPSTGVFMPVEYPQEPE